MKQLFKLMEQRNAEGKGTVLVTVVADRGSSPRGTGASMIVGEDGRLYGTIGGGMLEFEAVRAAAAHLQGHSGELRQYRLSKEETAGLGMVCGGNVDVLFTYVGADEETLRTLEQVLHCLGRHEEGWLVLGLEGGCIRFAAKPEEMAAGALWPKAGVTSVLCKDGGCKESYVQKLADQSRVYLFGGGHLSQELVPLLTHLEFRCVVTDDRPEFATRELFPDAEDVHVMDYDKLEGMFHIQPQDYIVIVTRGHIGDYEVEKFALKTPAYYIGAVGSKNKIRTVNEKLRAAGFEEAQIARVTSPIGISIGSETPAEIAVSIGAQLIERRASLGV